MPLNHFTQEQRDAFVAAANPHQWLLVAENLHEQAVAIWQRRGSGHLIFKSSNGSEISWDVTNRSAFLLSAFAMENILKAFAIFEHPALISKGYIDKKVKTHDLVELANLSSHIPYKERDRWVLEALSEGNESWARYPCGRDANDLRIEQPFTPKMWISYCSMMLAYFRKMETLLSRGWIDPFGTYSRWTFEKP